MQIGAELSEKWAWISGMFKLVFLIIFLGSVITVANSCNEQQLLNGVTMGGWLWPALSGKGLMRTAS